MPEETFSYTQLKSIASKFALYVLTESINDKSTLDFDQWIEEIFLKP